MNHPDPRSPAEQQAELSSAMSKLSGDYQVVESRNDKYSGYAHISVRSEGEQVVVTLQSPKNGTWKLQGTDCQGYDSVEHGFFDVMCKQRGGTVSYFLFGQQKRGRTVTDGAAIASFEPMTISGDEYLLDIGMRGGRSYYYRLKRQ
ncbi:hypothetical protein ACI2UK_13835 [Ralstonia nicotianae]|uniref:hypothetical protein n=1 Tax=Ralstonia pseudosolanacearum TaxID=1310165 RepID=UPI0020041260|nr:hypothetical protein [Ralstonia pseudosolanacearum]MCK4118376.1 hypothetical protein [Ralstonia pseudosolanacearum]